MTRQTFKFILSVIYPLVDFLTISLAILISYIIYRILGIGRQVYYEPSQIIPVALLAGLITVGILMNFGAYKRESSLLNVEEIKNVIKGISFSFLIFMLILVFGKFLLSRYVLFFSYLTSIFFVITERTLFYHMLPLTKNLKGLNKRVLIYGAGDLGQALFRAIANSPKIGIIPIGFIDDDEGKSGMVCHSSGFGSSSYSLSVLGNRKDIGQLIEQYEIDEIYIAISNISRETLFEIFDFLKAENVNRAFVPNLYKMFVPNMKLRSIGQIPLAREETYTESLYLGLKRYIDFILAVVLITLLWPLLLVIGFAIRIDSSGPALFKQKRVGKEGKIFQIYKFRSMIRDTDPYAVNPHSQNDSRITRVGQFLRKTSLDELPQIFNILKGEMSFVGPRPEMPFIVKEYNSIHKERLRVRPGITGLWQLSGDRKRAIHENMDYDLYYIRNVSFFLDLAILIETIIFSMRGI